MPGLNIDVTGVRAASPMSIAEDCRSNSRYSLHSSIAEVRLLDTNVVLGKERMAKGGELRHRQEVHVLHRSEESCIIRCKPICAYSKGLLGGADDIRGSEPQQRDGARQNWEHGGRGSERDGGLARALHKTRRSPADTIWHGLRVRYRRRVDGTVNCGSMTVRV